MVYECVLCGSTIIGEANSPNPLCDNGYCCNGCYDVVLNLKWVNCFKNRNIKSIPEMNAYMLKEHNKELPKKMLLHYYVTKNKIEK